MEVARLEDLDEENSKLAEEKEREIEAIKKRMAKQAQLNAKKSLTDDKFSKGMKKLSTTPMYKILETERVDKVYTVGCFDLFHEGHKILFQRLKRLGTQVIVGVHDSRSIFKLKNRVPIDGTIKRMSNVKQYADIVFCIHGTDPNPFLKFIYDDNEAVNSMYVRGDDMPDFPAKKFIEKVMPIHFLPYTENISTTKIRKELLNHATIGPTLVTEDATTAPKRD